MATSDASAGTTLASARGAQSTRSTSLDRINLDPLNVPRQQSLH
jgi:hypothetical protein